MNIIGKKFNKLTVLEETDKYNKSGHKLFLCRCDCGGKILTSKSALQRGDNKSCGCLRGNMHGMSNTRIYKLWQDIKKRCYNENNRAYKYYGGRGIKMCEEWKNDFLSFYNWAINNEYSDELTIDRINVDGDYEPNNCRWVTNEIQANNKTSNRYFTIDNETKSLADWCNIYNKRYLTVHHRLSRGSSIEEALDIKEFQRKREKLLELNNEKKTLVEWCKIYKVEYPTALNRINKGWSLEEALEIVKKRVVWGKLYEVNGEINNVANLSKIYNIKESTLYARLNNGWSIEEALGIIPRPRKRNDTKKD